jgi:5-methyltetrahydrofolate--homocysteine methyltransferase
LATPPDDLLPQIAQAIVNLMPKKAAQLTQAALDQGLPPRTILLEGLAAGMKRVGELFACKEFYVPEVLLASRAMEAGFALVRPRLEAGALRAQGRIILGVVHGDIHDIGKNIVKTLLGAEGFETIDLGKDVPVADFVRAVKEQKPDVLGLSSLMTTTMPVMEDVIHELQRQDLRAALKVIVGGAPLTAGYARQIGADAYAPDAPSAVREVKRLLRRDQ